MQIYLLFHKYARGKCSPYRQNLRFKKMSIFAQLLELLRSYDPFAFALKLTQNYIIVLVGSNSRLGLKVS